MGGWWDFSKTRGEVPLSASDPAWLLLDESRRRVVWVVDLDVKLGRQIDPLVHLRASSQILKRVISGRLSGSPPRSA